MQCAIEWRGCHDIQSVTQGLMHAADSTFSNMNVPSNKTAILSTRGALSLANCDLNNVSASNSTTSIVLAEQSGSLTLQNMPACTGCTGNVYATLDRAVVFADKMPGAAHLVTLGTVEQYTLGACPMLHAPGQLAGGT